MKRSIFFILSVSLLMACGGGGGSKEKATTTGEDVSKNPDYQKGLALVAKSNCLTCHKIDDKLIGPSYREIANKYGDMPDTIINHLAKQIINGSMGVWGGALMTDHRDLPQGDAEAMVKYILLLKNK